MATVAALVTDASDDGDLEAAQAAMRRENRLPSLINTAGHVCLLVSRLSAALDLLQGGRMAYLPPLEVEDVGRLLRVHRPSSLQATR
jgi:hypothetical protein